MCRTTASRTGNYNYKKRTSRIATGKAYLSYRLEELLQEQQAIDFYLRHHNANESRAMQLLNVDSPYYELLAPNFVPFPQEFHAFRKKTHKTPRREIEKAKTEAFGAQEIRRKTGFPENPLRTDAFQLSLYKMQFE